MVYQYVKEKLTKLQQANSLMVSSSSVVKFATSIIPDFAFISSRTNVIRHFSLSGIIQHGGRCVLAYFFSLWVFFSRIKIQSRGLAEKLSQNHYKF